MCGSVPTEDKGGTDETGTKSGPKKFLIGGLYGGRNPAVKKSSGKLVSSEVQTDFV